MRGSGSRRQSLAALALAWLVACAGQLNVTGDPGNSASSSTATTTTSTTSTEVLGSEEVARTFFAAWQAGERSIMESLANPAALAEADDLGDLAAEPWEPEPCEGAAGTLFCSWRSPAGRLAIGVANIEEPHVVMSVRLLEP
ncbi:MAG: hypothetical protein ACRDWH_07660 [Acidimicrobiia bacterium]